MQIQNSKFKIQYKDNKIKELKFKIKSIILSSTSVSRIIPRALQVGITRRRRVCALFLALPAQFDLNAKPSLNGLPKRSSVLKVGLPFPCSMEEIIRTGTPVIFA